MPLTFASIVGKLFGVDKGDGTLVGRTNVSGTAFPIIRVGAGRVQELTTAAVTFTVADQAEKIIVLNRAAGITVTLPALSAVGSGQTYRFFVRTTASGGSYIIKVANATDIIQGVMGQRGDDAASLGGFIAGASDDTITLNGTTTGGFRGDFIELVDVGNNIWCVRGYTQATGTEATPFSATV